MSSHSTNTCPAWPASRRWSGSWRLRVHRRSCSSPQRRIGDRRHRAEGRRRRYLVKAAQGDSFPRGGAQRRKGAPAQRACRRPATTPRADGPRLPRAPLCALAAEREVACCARSIIASAQLQIIASLLHWRPNASTVEDVQAARTNAMGRVAAVAQVNRRNSYVADLTACCETISMPGAWGSPGGRPKATDARMTLKERRSRSIRTRCGDRHYRQ